MTKGQNEARVDHIDIYRGIGIILMIMGHVEFGSRFNHFIHAFHMPMFFFVSGFLYRGSDGSISLHSFGKFVRKKARSLLLPYLIFGLLHYGFWLTFNEFSLVPLKHVFYINTNEMPIAGALWFLTALFFTDIFYYLIDRLIGNEQIKWCAIIALATFGTVYRSIFPKGVILPYALGAALVGLGFFHVGRKLREWSERGDGPARRLLYMKLPLLVISAAILCGLIFFNGYINMRSEKYGFIPLFWVNAVLSSVVLLNFSRRLEGLTFKAAGHENGSGLENAAGHENGSGLKKLAGMLLGYVRGIGRDSIVYLCLNQEMIHLLNDRFLPEGTRHTVVLALTLVMLFIANKLIMGTRLRFIVGK